MDDRWFSVWMSRDRTDAIRMLGTTQTYGVREVERPQKTGQALVGHDCFG